MAITVEPHVENIRLFVVQGTGLADDHVAIAQQELPRLTLPYATVQVISDGRIGREDVRTSDVEDGNGRVIETEKVQQEGTFTVQVFGPGAAGFLRKLQHAKRDQDVLDFLWNARLTVSHPIGRVRNINTVLSTTWEERAVLDFVFRWVSTSTRAKDAIETVTVNPTIT